MKISNSFKAGLLFGICMSLVYIVVSLAIAFFYTSEHLALSIYSSLAAGAVAGVLFGVSLAIFRNSKWFANATRISTLPGERVLFETGANHTKGSVAAGGKLYFTDKRIVFKSHKWNIQNHELSIDLENIRAVERFKNAWFINNGLYIITAENVKEKFVVEQVEEWVKFLSPPGFLLN